ncbi:C2 domain-containing protein [Crassisporium funariophilum]|nr:C2 domain-containing protein [Crassisporium funariophilum]
MATLGAANLGHGQAEATAIMKHDADKAGVPVHSFDPEASPQEKGAAAGKGGREKLQSVKQKDNPARELQLEANNTAPAVPTIVVHDVGEGEKPKVTATDTEQIAEDVQDEASRVPGALPTAAAPAIPDWYKVGWRQMSGIDNPPLPEGEERDKGVLDMFLGEQFYGSWYHNAAIIVFAVLASHFLTRFNFGWGWLFIILAICNTYYSTSMERVRRCARDDIQRELVKTRLASEHESAEWINNFLHRFWLIYEPVLSATIVSSVDQILSTNTPAFLDSLRLTQFTLGNKAPRIDKVRTFPKTDDDIVMMDWGLSFTPNDTSEMTQKQKDNKVNPRIALSVRVGKGLATAALPILVEDITLSGLLRIRMKLMSNFPHVQVVDICFLEKPVIDYVLKPIGGDTFGFDIANMPGLSSFIREMTHATLGPMMYDPNVFTLNLEQMLSGKPLDAAIGVIQVVVRSARGIKGTKIGGGTPDPFVSLSIENRAELARTKYKNNTYNPTWQETKYILVNSLNEQLILNLYDFNDHRKDTLLGSTSFDLNKLLEDSTQEDLVAQLLKDGKDRGELRYDVNYYPVIEPEEGSAEVLDSTVGIVRLILHQAKELDQSKSLSGDLNPLAKVYLNSSPSSSFATPCFKHTASPVWEAPHEFLCTDKASATITIKVIDDRDFLKDPVVGYMSIRLVDLLDMRGQAGKDWFPLSGCRSGKMRVSAEWKPLSMAGSLHGSEQYRPPIGVVRLLIDKATDVKNVEATLGGKSDPYVRVQVQNVTKGRTEVVNNNLNPVWDQIIYIPVHSLKENLMLECMDYQHLTRDRSLGSVELHVADLAAESEDPRYPYESKGVKKAADPLLLEKGHAHKGDLHYTAEFIPALHLKNVKFEASNSEAKRLTERQDEEGGDVSDGSSSSDEDDVPNGLTINAEKKAHNHHHHQKPVKPTIDATSVHTADNGSIKTNGTSASPTTPTSANGNGQAKKEDEGVEMSNEELLVQPSGIVVFNIISGNLSKKGRLEVLLDDGYWPCFSTIKARSTNAQWGYVGEGFIKEVDFGRVWLRLNEADEGEKDDIVAEWKGDAKAFLQSTLNGPQTYSLVDDEDRKNSTVVVEAKYIPVPVKLEPRESVNNQGIVRVDLLDGREIRGVDRGGKSDPYAVFQLNGQKVFKSQTKKKTVTPEWNEHFEVSVPSRVGAEFHVEIFDWNQIEQAKSLGIGKIELSDIEPFQATERIITLAHNKHGEKGSVRIRLVFQPEIIAKSRKNTSTFTSAGRAMTQIGGLPVSAGKGVLHGVAGVFKRGDKDHEEPVPDLPSGQASQPVGVANDMEVTRGGLASFPSSENGHAAASGEPGTLRVTVMDAKDLAHQDIKPYATLRVGDKEFKTKHTHKTSSPEWNESFIFAASALTPKMYVWIHDHKTLGKDKEVGEGEVDIWRHIKPEGVSSADVFLELKQGGLMRLRLEFDASSNPNSNNGSIHSGHDVTRTLSIASPSRFSIRGRRPADNEDQ